MKAVIHDQNYAVFKALGRRPKEWHNCVFPVPRKCVYCDTTVWGKGLIGRVYWTYDIDVYRAHVACRTLEVLSGEN